MKKFIFFSALGLLTMQTNANKCRHGSKVRPETKNAKAVDRVKLYGLTMNRNSIKKAIEVYQEANCLAFVFNDTAGRLTITIKRSFDNGAVYQKTVAAAAGNLVINMDTWHSDHYTVTIIDEYGNCLEGVFCIATARM